MLAIAFDAQASRCRNYEMHLAITSHVSQKDALDDSIQQVTVTYGHQLSPPADKMGSEPLPCG